MKTSSKPLVLLFVAALLGAGCGSHGTPTPAAPSDTPTPPTPAEPAANGHPGTPAPTDVAPTAFDGATVRDVGFELRATAGGPYHAGQAGTFGVTLTPGAGYHVNEEYPIRVELTAPAEVTLPKATLARADAADFGPTKAHFEVPFTAAVEGERRVQLTVGFAVCTPERCMPDERTLSVVLPIVP